MSGEVLSINIFPEPSGSFGSQQQTTTKRPGEYNETQPLHYRDKHQQMMLD
jgi:hypothetical protein